MQQRQQKVWRAATGGVPAGMPHTLVLAPLMVGVAAVMVLANASAAGMLLLRGLRPRSAARRGPRTQEADLRRLRRALLGHPPAQVAQMLGPPPSSARTGPDDSLDTWYYPIRTHRRYAMAIRFYQGLAQAVDFVPEPN
jgi:hypothetical protein